jgi:hypothetical protein
MWWMPLKVGQASREKKEEGNRTGWRWCHLSGAQDGNPEAATGLSPATLANMKGLDSVVGGMSGNVTSDLYFLKECTKKHAYGQAGC